MIMTASTGAHDPVLSAMIAGTWLNPETGERTSPIPFRDIRIMDSTEGAEADLLAPLGLGRRLAVVSDTNTHEAMGARVAAALRAIATVDDIVIAPGEATIEVVEDIAVRTRHADALIAVGAGTVQDLVKYTTFLDKRRFVTFATAASMNGYTSITASIAKGGFKHSLKAHTPEALFMDVAVAAAAPPFLARAGIGDCLCRSTAQVDWRMSTALTGTPYFELPFTLQRDDERTLLGKAAGLDAGEPEAIHSLYRLLTWTGLGTCFTGTSHHGSMSEHLVSHWIDMFAGDDHPGTLHGHQVGFAAVSMSRLQHKILLADAPPKLRPTVFDRSDLETRYGATIGVSCFREMQGKALDRAAAEAMTAKLAENWDEFRAPLIEVMLPTETLEKALADSGGYLTATQSGLPERVYRDALLHAREIRNRFSILDIAGDSGVLAGFAEAEAARKPATNREDSAP